MGGMLRGMGKATVCSSAVLCVYWLLVMPLGLLLAYRGSMGVLGMWVAMTFGQACLALRFGSVINSVKFDVLAEEVSASMKQQGEEVLQEKKQVDLSSMVEYGSTAY